MQPYKSPADRPSWYRFLKRFFDLTASLAALVLLSPVFLIVAILVYREDGAPVFYRHPRVGRWGKPLGVYKFRSMKRNADQLKSMLTEEQLAQYQREFKIDNDPRITRIGDILRRTSLDELPQLLNIIKGEMSVIGPRPIVEDELDQYTPEQREKLLNMKPGLTGYWQAYARNNATYATGERQKMEMYYVEHANLWLDIKILFKTVVTVITKDGAQ